MRSLIFQVWIWGFLLGLLAIIAAVAIKILITRHRVKSLIDYCGIDMIDVFKAEPARVSRMIYEKLIEKGNLLVYKNDNLKRRMKTAGINEDADDYGYDLIEVIVRVKESPEAEEAEIIKMEIIDFYFADLSKKSDEIKQLFIDLQRFKEEVDWHGKMAWHYAAI